MAMFVRFSARRRVAKRLLGATAAGLIIAVSIGLGAHNAVWVAVLGCFGIVAGLAVAPRPSRTAELPEWELAGSSPGTRVRVDSITRSAVNAESTQPTVVSGRIAPVDDADYRATWITSMSKSHTAMLINSGTAKLLPVSVPPRQGTPPRFGDHPGIWAVIYPAVTLAACAALLFGVPANVWHVDVPTPQWSSDDDAADVQTNAADENLNTRLNAMVGEMSSLGSTALRIQFTDSGDYGTFYNPDTGNQVSINRSADGKFGTRRESSSTQRDDDTFNSAAFAATDLTALVAAMQRRLERITGPTTLRTLELTRSADSAEPIATATFEHTASSSRTFTVAARPDGTVAEYFNPGDFVKAFELARDALTAQQIPLTRPVITRFEIRGTAQATPIMYAGAIQNSGGVLIDYTTPTKRGDIVLVPGEFPEVRTTVGTFRPPDDGVTFTQLSPAVFNSVRAQAMSRGKVRAFDRDAVDIEAVDDDHYDVPAPFIRIVMSRSDAAAGRYSMTGKFLAPGYY